MSFDGKRNLLAIIGATGSGKSALAMAVAKATGAEILSVDAMQMYQGMDIGTAKPTAAERKEVRHHVLNWVRPDESFSVARYEWLAEKTIADARERNVPLIAVGGSPLYFKAIFFGLFDGPAADPEVRERLAAGEPDELHRRLAEVDPAAAARIHAGDRKRLIRALEVFELTGKPISSLQTDWEAAPRFAATWVGLRWTTEELNRRLNSRVKAMIEAGWVKEVRKLDVDYSPWSTTAATATGYNELLQHIQGKMSLEDAVEQIKIATRQLARRQMKWYRRFPGVTWLDGNSPLEENVKKTLELWHG